jgi:hypothetical protein
MFYAHMYKARKLATIDLVKTEHDADDKAG